MSFVCCAYIAMHGKPFFDRFQFKKTAILRVGERKEEEEKPARRMMRI